MGHKLNVHFLYSALSYHPNNPSLYILASSHTLDAQQSPSAARTLLQRGLRLNKDSVELWRAYVGMELGFVVTTGRRWGVLGISDDKGKGKEKQHDLDGDDTVMEDEAYMSVEARKEILNGAIVKRVISAAVEGNVPFGSTFRLASHEFSSLPKTPSASRANRTRQ